MQCKADQYMCVVSKVSFIICPFMCLAERPLSCVCFSEMLLHVFAPGKHNLKHNLEKSAFGVQLFLDIDRWRAVSEDPFRGNLLPATKPTAVVNTREQAKLYEALALKVLHQEARVGE